ncbi:MAG: DNA polymerase III, partial [Candidatus Pacebacteria bacterium]|nr:DNA polymerase III [Candidatus Paceibacterota bacterium]
DRLDLSNYHIKRAKEIGCKFFINTDTHALKQMDRMEYGVNEARRGWAEKKDIINTLSLREVEKFLNKR